MCLHLDTITLENAKNTINLYRYEGDEYECCDYQGARRDPQ